MSQKSFLLAFVLGSMFGQALAVEAKIATGVQHTLFIDDGSVFAMGANAWGETKNDPTKIYRTPQFTGIQEVVSVAAGEDRSAALKKDGSVVLWGRQNQRLYVDKVVTVAPYSPPITGTVDDIAFTWDAFFYLQKGVVYRWPFTGMPVAVSYPGDGHVKSIATGQQHLVALFSDGTVGTYGKNTDGQLGNGSAVVSHTYVMRIPRIQNATSISAGRYTSFAQTSTGEVYGWGKNSSEQFADGTKVNWSIPKPLPFIAGAKKVYGSNIATIALMPDGTLRVAGFPNYIYTGKLGSIYNYAHQWMTLVPVAGVKDIAQGWGDANMVDLGKPGVIFGWSMNRMGQLGSNSLKPEEHVLNTAVFTPVPPPKSSVNGNGQDKHQDVDTGNVFLNPFGSMRDCNAATLTKGSGQDCKNTITPDNRGDGNTTKK